jgi:hypothetical protein
MQALNGRLRNIVMILIIIASWLSGSMASIGQAQPLRSFFEKKEGNYFGYEIAMGLKASILHSDVAQLNSLRNGQINTTVGIVFLNEIGKLRANVGLSYSDGRVPYSINTAEGGLMGNLYLLRLINKKSSFIEPYFVGRVGYQGARFFGTYLSKDQITNYSQCDLPAIGRISWVNTLAGLGADFKIANEEQYFIHLFGEIMTGANFLSRSSVSDLANTRATNPLRVTFGISFGLTREP